MFNKRRSGEASRLPVSDYERRKTWKDANTSSELVAVMSPMEKNSGKPRANRSHWEE